MISSFTGAAPASETEPSKVPAVDKRKHEMVVTAHQIIQEATSKYPPHLLLRTALKTRGAFTDLQLQRVFRKCLIPGAIITVGAVGGSIAAGAGNIGTRRTFVQRVGETIQRLCPDATVEIKNAATGARGSLLSAACLTNFVGDEVDLLLIDFTLNDYLYPDPSSPYELLLRAARTAFLKHPPAIISVYFWGQTFKYPSAQDMHVELCEYYGVTGISMRDVVWPLYVAKQAPYEAREKIVVDTHHPSIKVHNHLGTILSSYIAHRIIEWAALTNATTTNTVTTTSNSTLYELPAPVSAAVAQYQLNHTSPGFTCGLTGTPQSQRSMSLPLYRGWELVKAGKNPEGLLFVGMPSGGTFPHHPDIRLRADSKFCYQPVRPEARVLWEVDLHQGHIMAHRCYNEKKESRRTLGFSFLFIDPEDPENARSLHLVEAINGTLNEMFRIDPPLPPGRHTIAIVIEPLPCPQPLGTNPKCDAREWAKRADPEYTGGFDALITL